ncbi:GNAT family N-acetyltransferase [Catenuloplanes indicus]|uniref:Ribosomal protein S18 acetylase RimI-like enzyme n=1 Tax=Catenuloplanes indicus TaxID=137267 RepID=A0AAE3W6R1_9ACTN|nr:N-acetyltransferase [Catenuloplanes indicus]MDQ0369659.1 ribosomal protein S18 acetylase RimI-like enzyme [Catenuloplanes indicus]
MITVRRAGPSDAAELVRLRAVMIRDAFDGEEPPPGEWREIAERQFRARLADSAGLLAAFVVDRPDDPQRLAACAVGSVDTRIASPHSLSGESGYIFNVATDPAYRRRGFSRACMEDLIEWFAKRGVARVTLHASPDGEPGYRALGFTAPRHTALQLDLWDRSAQDG